MGGWDSKKIHAKVQKYQGEWTAKGISVNYNMVTWMHWVSHGQSGGHMQVEYRYWMTYADMEIAPGFKPKNAFNPDMDYAKPQDSSAPKDGMSEP